MDELEANRPEEVNIEKIMQEIREQILAQKGSVSGEHRPIVPVSGQRFPPELYEHLYQAGLAYDQVGIKMYVTKVNIPIVGPLIEWLRSKFHQLVLYYVNQVAAQQVRVNTHLLHAISILTRDLEAHTSESVSEKQQ